MIFLQPWFLEIDFFMHKPLWFKTWKAQNNVFVEHVLQHFSTEYVLTKLVLQYEMKIWLIKNNITGYLARCYIYVFFNNTYKRLGHMSVKREYLSSPVKSWLTPWIFLN